MREGGAIRETKQAYQNSTQQAGGGAVSERQNKGNKLSLSTWLTKVASGLVFQGGDWSSGRTRSKQPAVRMQQHSNGMQRRPRTLQTDEMVSVWEEGPGSGVRFLSPKHVGGWDVQAPAPSRHNGRGWLECVSLNLRLRLGASAVTRSFPSQCKMLSLQRMFLFALL